MQQCDNKSVGVIIKNENNEVILLERARFPLGLAPPAGHIDEHGGYIEAAIAEVFEEVGIHLVPGDLKEVLHNIYIPNICRRLGGSHHTWRVYETTIASQKLMPDPNETNGAGWYSMDEVRALSAKVTGRAEETTQADMPILEHVWCKLLTQSGVL